MERTMNQPLSHDVVESFPNQLWITWVDDVFNSEVISKGSRLPFKLVEAFLSGAYKPKVKTPDLRILEIAKEICEKRGVNFRIACFEYFGDPPSLNALPSDEYYLIDINYTGVGEYYGMNLVDELGLPNDRFRFLSGFPELPVEAHERGYPENQSIHKRSRQFGEHLNEWLDMLLIHPDPAVRGALEFYCQPWTQGGWPGKWHEGQKPNHSNPRYPQELAKWLGMEPKEVDMTSSKGLLIWRPEKDYWGDWYLGKFPQNKQREGYPLLGKVLVKVLERLEIPAEGIDEGSKYSMPVDPSLPFLLSLRVFTHSEGTIPRVIWNRFESGSDVVVYHIEIASEQIDWGLRDRYYDRGGRGVGKADPLDSLMNSEIHLKSIDNEWKRLFTMGVKKKGIELLPCGLCFTPGSVHLFWTSRKL